MKGTPNTNGWRAPADGRVRIFKKRRASRDLPPLDLRTPSGRRTLPY